MKIFISRIKYKIVFGFVVLLFNTALGQQFSSDNYLSKPQGIATIILTKGNRNTMYMNTFSLFPRWEITAAAYIYNSDKDPLTDDGYSTSFYVKYMIYENAAKNGGVAVKAGKGLDPGFIDGTDEAHSASETYWMNAPFTFPFFKGKVSLDVMPGESFTLKYGDEHKTAVSFTYTSRIAYYPFVPEFAVVGEIFGSKGQVKSTAEYRTGLRWEPSQYANIALTYGGKVDGSRGAGWEIGVMLFTPPFACIGGCK